MQCSNCKNQGKIKTNQGYTCHRCFSRTIEKRVRKFIRINKIFKAKDSIFCEDNLTFHLVKSIMNNIPCDIRKTKTKDSINLYNFTLDDQNYGYLTNLFKKRDQIPEKKSILIVLTDEEAKTYSKINKIEYKPKEKEKDLKKLIDSMQKKYPETKFALAKSINVIKS